MKANPLATKSYLQGIIDKGVKQGGRSTMAVNISRDPYDVGYARIPDGESCDFCRMLGSRGFIYHSEQSAGGGELHGTEADTYHPWCNCQIAVSFDRAVQEYWVGMTHVTRGYADDGVVVSPGRDGSYELREIDIDELLDEYKAAGKSYTSRGHNKTTNWETRHDLEGGSTLTDEQMREAKARMAAATTLEELRRIAHDVVARWKPNKYGKNVHQWNELSAYAQRLQRQFV